jgi:hypothetical protein
MGKDKDNNSKELVLNKSIVIGVFVVIIFALFFENVLIVYKELDKKALSYTSKRLEMVIGDAKFKSKDELKVYMLKCIEENVHTTNLPSLVGYKGMVEHQYKEYAINKINLCKSSHISDAKTSKEKRSRKLLWQNLKLN